MASKAKIEKFRALSRQEFRYLVEDFDFVEQKIPNEESINQYQIQYANKSTFIKVEGIHYGQAIDVRIGRLKPEPWETYKHYDLEDLIGIRCTEMSLIGPDGFSTSNDQAFQLKHYGSVLKKCAIDVLRGDFSIFPQLHDIIERRAEQFKRSEI